MINILNFYEAGKARSGTALIPFFDSTKITLAISTRYGRSVIDKGDGSFYNYSNPHFIDYSTGASDGVNRITLNYSTAYTGNISINFKQGLKDVYSISTFLFRDSATDTKLNILNIESFFSQFPNLYSVRLLEHCYLSTEKSVFKGDLSRFPDSVERIYISCIEVQNAATDLILNFSNYNNSSKLKYFNFSGDRAYLANSNMKVLGDISKIPPLCNYLYLLKAATGSSITYTAGKVWASSFDTLSIPLALTTAELDNLLIDMDNSITTKIGAGVIALGGYRSSASDSAVASLVAKGFTVNVNRGYQILNLPFQNSFTDSGEMGMTMVAGGTSNEPTFALSGRKAGEYCAVFNGSQSLKTTTNLPINSDKITVLLSLKTNETNAFVMATGNTGPTGANGFFDLLINAANLLRVRIGNTDAQASFVNNEWTRFAIVIDRSLFNNETKVYKNGAFHVQSTGNVSGNFVNEILYFGQRGGVTPALDAMIMNVSIYNYPLTPAEVTADYNAFL